jgi:hypothetical protein
VPRGIPTASRNKNRSKPAILRIPSLMPLKTRTKHKKKKKKPGKIIKAMSLASSEK